MDSQTLLIDGSKGEGGGQILRTALSLSVLTRRPIRIERIRAGRAKPGLMRQHLTCVKAAATISAADVAGAEPGSTTLEFKPHTLVGGAHHFAIGTAGSAMLVLQTILPALLRADQPSRITLEGGTHNAMAPSADFIQRCLLPQLSAMGASVRLELERHGLFPAGGGRVVAHIQPGTLSPLNLTERGASRGIHAEALIAGVPSHVAERELARLAARFRLRPHQIGLRDLGPRTGPGNVLSLWAEFDAVCELITQHGERGLAAETVSDRAATELARYLDAEAPIGEHLADQLLLPLWLAGSGRFDCTEVSEHLRTNVAILNAFGGPQARIESLTARHHTVQVA